MKISQLWMWKCTFSKPVVLYFNITVLQQFIYIYYWPPKNGVCGFSEVCQEPKSSLKQPHNVILMKFANCSKNQQRVCVTQKIEISPPPICQPPPPYPNITLIISLFTPPGDFFFPLSANFVWRKRRKSQTGRRGKRRWMTLPMTVWSSEEVDTLLRSSLFSLFQDILLKKKFSSHGITKAS